MTPTSVTLTLTFIVNFVVTGGFCVWNFSKWKYLCKSFLRCKCSFCDFSELPEHAADLWLESIARGTMHLYGEQVLKVHQLTPHATKQLITDMGQYICTGGYSKESNNLKRDFYYDV